MATFDNIFATFEDLHKIRFDRGRISVVYIDGDERSPTSAMFEAISEVLDQIHWFFMPTDKVTFIVLRETQEVPDQMVITEPLEVE